MEAKKTNPRQALNTLSSNIPIRKTRADKNVPINLTKKVECPAEKTSLVNKLKERYSTDDRSTEKDTNPAKRMCFSQNVDARYTTDDEATQLEKQYIQEGYQKDYIRFLLHEEKKFVLDSNFLKKTFYTISSRYGVVNLLLRLQQYFKLPEHEYYMAVKLMDFSSQICSDPNEGVLLAITSLWLVHKYTDNTNTISPKAIFKALTAVSSRSYMYRVEDVLKMERKILLFTNFIIRLPEPSIFLEHYIRKLKLIPDKNIYHGSYFVCDCLSKFPKFSFLPPSLVAAIALYTTLVVMKQDTSRFLQMTQNVFYEAELKIHYSDTIANICYIYKNIAISEPFGKYSLMKYNSISFYWEKCIKKILNSSTNTTS